VSSWDQYYATPFLTRSTAIVIICIYVAGLLVGDSNPMKYADCPMMTVMHLQLYRPLVAPFVAESILGLLFTVLVLVQLGSYMEQTLGTSHFALLSMVFLIAGSAAQMVLVLGLFFSGILPEAMMMMSCSVGLWPLLLAFMVLQSQASGEEHTRLLCLPINIPTKWYPLALLGLFTLLGGFKLSLFIFIGMGYYYAKGKLPWLAVSSNLIQQLEAKFGVYQNSTGFFMSDRAPGFENGVGSASLASSQTVLPFLQEGSSTAGSLVPFSGGGQSIGSSPSTNAHGGTFAVMPGANAPTGNPDRSSATQGELGR